MLLFFFSVLLSYAVAAPPPNLNDQPYAQVGGQPLVLDLSYPQDGSTAPWPCVVHIHGGAWLAGSHNPPWPASINSLLVNGFAVASVQYRLTSQGGQWGGEPVIFPAQIHDVKAAVRYLRANAAGLQIRPDAIAAWGSSAGGHLAALLALSGDAPALEGSVGSYTGYSSAIYAAVDYYGPVDFLQMDADVTNPPGSVIVHDAPNSPESVLIGFDGAGEGIGVLRNNLANPNPPFPALAVLVGQTNPITWISAGDPPLFVYHGEADTLVPTNQGQRLANALQAGGIDHILIRLVGQGHNDPPAGINQQAVDFLIQRIPIAPSALNVPSAAGGEWTLY